MLKCDFQYQQADFGLNIKLEMSQQLLGIVGTSGSGKSTLLNALLGEKIAIVSNKPQTTRNRILGVHTGDHYQLVFLDTPGMHTPRTRLGEYMMQTVKEALQGIDALMVVVDATHVSTQDRDIVRDMSERKIKKTLVLNKIDLLPKENLLQLIGLRSMQSKQP